MPFLYLNRKSPPSHRQCADRECYICAAAERNPSARELVREHEQMVAETTRKNAQEQRVEFLMRLFHPGKTA